MRRALELKRGGVGRSDHQPGPGQKGAAVFGNARKGGLLGLLAKKKEKGSKSESDSNSDFGSRCAQRDCAQLSQCPNRVRTRTPDRVACLLTTYSVQLSNPLR